jgi:hypothetical protein
MSIQIDVDFKDKEKAKQKGAFWDAELKTWYIPDNKNILDFTDWFPSGCDVIIKSPFYIAYNTRTCWKCHKETPLIAIGADKFIVLDYIDDESDDRKWNIQNYFTLFSDITFIPKNIIELIQNHYPFFKLAFSKTVNGKYWANTCVNCNALQGDWFNHNEPDGAFFPCSPEDARKIKLKKIELKHDFPIIGGYSFGDSNDFTYRFAKRE